MSSGEIRSLYESTSRMVKTLSIAVQGCAHGELLNIYSKLEAQYGSKLPDLLIILGDFQSLRNEDDMESIAIPDRYKRLGDFPKYYSGELEAPILTIFIGGNHECMQGLAELPSGGFIAKNIYYMGYSGSVVIQGITISGLSGIYKHHDFNSARPSLEHIKIHGWHNYVRSMYHVRKSDVLPLFMLSKSDIMLSHDWPNGVVGHGNVKTLIKLKPYFKEDIRQGKLGSPVNWELLRSLMPRWWLSAHLHVKYEAEVVEKKRGLQETNPDEIDLDLDFNESSSSKNCNIEPRRTKFLALDKCGPKRKHMSLLELPVDEAHPTFDSNEVRMYVNPEFEANRDFLTTNKATARKLQDIDFEELRHQRGDAGEINWEHYELKH
ncbi:LADA_0E08218g1_1 [Lachancea dasiensis]|uniref:LADA_0E08218g1_1 n=1 Tax=Lachancea dasiensis TaxID=1072105 RepID=A0A1G4JDW9_9SACH|nr:LADA_0E08218g1_1 [Lachancea dasiensis]